MPTRFKRRDSKYLGQRTHGGGNKKNRRGAGNRGGHGLAGKSKHHFFKSIKSGRNKSEPGFTLEKIRLRAINVSDLDILAEKGKLEKDGEFFVYRSKTAKLLGCGKTSRKFKLEVASASKSAREKLKGSAIEIAKIHKKVKAKRTEKKRASKFK